MRRNRMIVACLATALGAGAAQAGDINSMEQALAEAGTCVYPTDYVDTLAQGSMAPRRDMVTAGAGGVATTDALIARVIAARDYAGGMTPLPVPLLSLIVDRAAGGS